MQHSLVSSFDDYSRVSETSTMKLKTRIMACVTILVLTYAPGFYWTYSHEPFANPFFYYLFGFLSLGLSILFLIVSRQKSITAQNIDKDDDYLIDKDDDYLIDPLTYDPLQRRPKNKVDITSPPLFDLDYDYDENSQL